MNRRKVLLINRKFQLSIIGWFALLAAILISIYYFSMYYFFSHITQQATAAGLAPDHVFFTYLGQQQELMSKIFLLSSVVAVVVIFIGGLYLSQKVAGPLYRFTNHLRAHSKANVTPVRFRKGDYFPEIEEEFNKYIER